LVVELNDYLRVLQRRWLIVAIATLFGLAVGFFTASDGPTAINYTATQTLSVIQPTANASAPSESFTASQLAVYATVGEVPRRVAEELDYPGTPQELAATIVAEPDDLVGVLRITATDADGERAALIANSFGRKLRAVVSGDARRELQTQIANAEDEVDDLQGRVDDLDAQLALAPVNAAVLTAQRDALVNQYRIAYDELQSLRTSTTDSETVVTLEAAVPQRAEEGLSAPKSRPARMALFGLLGLLLGAALALILDRVDTRIRTKEDAEAVSGLPVLSQIPFLPRRHRHELISASRPASPFAEAYRNLRSTLAFARGPLSLSPHYGTDDEDDSSATPAQRAIDHEPTVILVTSSGPYEGKTTTIANLAASYAETDRSVLILDCDFRRPRLHQVFGTRETPGLADVLENPRRFSADHEVMCSTSVDGVRLVPAGTPTDNPARLFNQARILIGASRRQADIVLIDTPPYLVANDAAELIPWVDAVVITVRSRRTRRDTTERMVENLHRQQASVVGIVLIGADDAGAGYSPYYYHRANARTDKARRRWRRILRLGPTKDKTSTQPEPEEPQPEDLTAARSETFRENGAGTLPAADTEGQTGIEADAHSDTRTDTDKDTDTVSETDRDAQADGGTQPVEPLALDDTAAGEPPETESLSSPTSAR